MRRTKPPHPAGCDPFEVQILSFLDEDFLDVGSRINSIEQRLESHGKWLAAKVRELPTVEGNDKELSTWIAQLKLNTHLVDHQKILPLNDENSIVIAINRGAMKPQDISDDEWSYRAKNRYKAEWPSRRDASEKVGGMVNGWARLFPKSESGYGEFPVEYFAAYRDWTVNRAKELKEIQVSFSLGMYGGAQSGKPGAIPIFDQYASEQGNWKLPDFISNAQKAVPVFLNGYRGILLLELPRNHYNFVTDGKIPNRLEAAVVAHVIASKRIASKDAFSGIEDVITIHPESVQLSYGDKNDVAGTFKVLSDAELIGAPSQNDGSRDLFNK